MKYFEYVFVSFDSKDGELAQKVGESRGFIHV